MAASWVKPGEWFILCGITEQIEAVAPNGDVKTGKRGKSQWWPAETFPTSQTVHLPNFDPNAPGAYTLAYRAETEALAPRSNR